MGMYVSLLWGESLRFSISSMLANPFRFLLSSFGVTVGIFCILGIWTLVDGLRAELNHTLNTFSNPYRIHVDKWPWRTKKAGQYPWWKYVRRPYASYEEYQYLANLLADAQGVAIKTNGLAVSAKYERNTVPGSMIGVSHSFTYMENMEIVEGRSFSDQESKGGRDVTLIGHTIAEELGIASRGLGKRIKIRGRTYKVIGVLKEQGENLFGSSIDENIYVPFKSITKVVRVSGRRSIGSSIIIDGTEGGERLDQLEGEVRQLMRAGRALRPSEEDNFAINKGEMMYNFAKAFLSILTIVGSVIASFSIIVGAFNIANVMFISVKERTFQVGLQKALGARRAFILLQFLFESVLLTLVGGVIGIGVAYVGTWYPFPLELSLSAYNVGLAVCICGLVGVVAGGVPAYRASRMDPIAALGSS